MSLPEAITAKPSNYQPTNADLEETFRLEDVSSFPEDELGETEEGQLDAMAWTTLFRSVKIKRQK